MEKDIVFFREQYKRQKKLENIVNNRTIVRPKTKKRHITAMYFILPFLTFIVGVLVAVINIAIVYKVLLCVLFILLIIEVHLRICLILAVRYYQRYAPIETRKRCKCIPSCSEYALLTLKKIFPLVIALIKIRKRLYKTCNGEEYKVDFPTKKMNIEYERKL